MLAPLSLYDTEQAVIIVNVTAQMNDSIMYFLKSIFFQSSIECTVGET